MRGALVKRRWRIHGIGNGSHLTSTYETAQIDFNVGPTQMRRFSASLQATIQG